jgi:hypothetical protein
MSCDEEMQIDSEQSLGANRRTNTTTLSAAAAAAGCGTSVTGADGVSLSLGEYEECLLDSENGEEPTGLMGAAFHSRVPFDKMTSLECQYFPGK